MSHLAKDMTPDVTWKEITPGCNIYEAVLPPLWKPATGVP